MLLNWFQPDKTWKIITCFLSHFDHPQQSENSQGKKWYIRWHLFINLKSINNIFITHLYTLSYMYFPQIPHGPTWSWLYGSWIYNYQCLSPLTLLESRSIHYYVIKFGSDLRQGSVFPRILRFPPPIKLTDWEHHKKVWTLVFRWLEQFVLHRSHPSFLRYN